MLKGGTMKIINKDIEDRIIYVDTDTYDSNGRHVSEMSQYRKPIDLQFNISGVSPNDENESSYIKSEAYLDKKDRTHVSLELWNSDGDRYGGATIHFTSIEEIDQLAEQLKEEFRAREDICDAREQLENEGWEKHPDSYKTQPTLMERCWIETGEYFWDIDKLESTAAFYPDEYKFADTQFDSYKNEAYKWIENLKKSCKQYPELHLYNLATKYAFYLSSYAYGVRNHKQRLETDRRRKKKVCTLIYADGTTKTIDGHWEFWYGNFQEVVEW